MFSFFGQSPDRSKRRRVVSGPIILCRIATSLMALGLVSTAHAEPQIPLSLAETGELALASEPGRLELQARASALRAQSILAGQLPDPSLRLGLNNFPVESGGFSTEGMTHALVGVRQVFPAGDTLQIRSRQFDLLAGEMNESADARSRNVLTAAQSTWLKLYYLTRARILLRDSRPYFEDLVTATLSLYAVGRKSQQDVLRAELELGRLDERVIDVEQQISMARAALGEWIGENAQRPIGPALPPWERVPDLESLQAALLDHPAIRASDARIASRETGVELAHERTKPGWALDLAYSYRDGMLPGGEPRSDFISLNVTVDLPFFRRKSVDSTLSAALHERSAAEAGKQRQLRELHSRLAAEYAHWHQLSRRLELYENSILAQASSNAEASMLAYQSDRGDFADVMRAYVDDLDTRIDHIRLQVERAQTYAVLANLGGLQR